MPSTTYARTVDLPVDHDRAVQLVSDLLKQEGFGVLTTIDARRTLKEKLGAEIPPYTILGACHPPSALRAIQAEEAIGILLPCNVVVKGVESGGSRVFLTRVEPLFGLVGRPDLADLADDVDARLARVAGRLAEARS